VFCRIAAEPSARLCGYVAVQMDPKIPHRHDRHLEPEIDPVMCILFVVFVFLIVPFTLLSPFRYPQTSVLDKLLSVNQQYESRGVDTRLSGYRVIDLSVASSGDSQATTGSLAR
jgi:hypothetical protein